MRRLFHCFLVPLLAATFSAAPGWAAPANHGLNHIQVNYNGGPLLQHPRVATLFWGSSWKGSSLPSYFNGFFKALFIDGSFMANLSQYSAGDYKIGDGVFAGSATDEKDPPARVHDSQIQAEIQAQIDAGHLPKLQQDSLYFIFTPPQVVVVDKYGATSTNNFAGYHDFVPGSDGFPYAVIPYDATQSDPRQMTIPASHELAEAVTDPEPGDTTLGWYDDNNGEIGDIPVSLYAANRIGIKDLIDELDAPDGAVYLVQKQWSVKDNAPVAFATAAGQ